MHTVREHNRPCGTCMAVRSAWTVLGFAALGLAFCSFVSAAIATRVNRKMAGLTAPAVKASSVGGGAPVQTDSARGKVLLVNFFASWCPPCNKEMDNLQRLRASVSADKLMIVGIAMDPVVTPETVGKVKSVVQRHRLTYPVVLATKELVKSFQCPGFPDTYVIDPKGRFVEALEGYHPPEKLTAEVRALLPAGTKLPPTGRAGSASGAEGQPVVILPSTPPSGSASSFQQAIWPILHKSCALGGCHTGATPAAGLAMEDASSTYKALVNAPSTLKPTLMRVKPGKPDESVLWLKVTGRHKQAGIFGTQMPPTGLLDADDQKAIERWIRDGAPG